MESPLKVLLVAEGSGGHVIPALQVARTLASRGVAIKMWYAERRSTERLMRTLTEQAGTPSIDVKAIPLDGGATLLGRLRECGRLWRQAQQCFDTFAPDVVVGFGGWVSAPIVLAAKRRHIRCMLHEQNVELGRTNRWLSPWVDRVAVSFEATERALPDARAVTTGLPIRAAIGSVTREDAAARCGLSPGQPTLVVFGGSQGAQAINRLMMGAAAALTSSERQLWQIVHVRGPADHGAVQEAYAQAGVRAWTAPFLADMEIAYAMADVAIARAGASTITELARCGVPSILIPYPHAGGHQRANARVLEMAGGGLILEEADATSEQLLRMIRHLLNQPALRQTMRQRLQALHQDDASQRLSDTIVEVAQASRTDSA